MPGTIMAMGRLNRPSIMVYGGTIKVWDFTFHNFLILLTLVCSFFFFFLGANDHSPEFVPVNYREELLGGGPNMLVRNFESKTHRCHEALGTIRPTPWGSLLTT